MNYILGRTGMLGSMVANTWDGDFISTDRTEVDATQPFDLPDADWVINCIGIIKPYCDNIQTAIKVNALFPHTLPQKTIQIATDCVYSGSKGNYVETDPHDALDVYGKTKSLGEAPHIKNLRCSIIGPEVKNHISLYDQVLVGKVPKGYTNHSWNGITTYAFSKICQGIIREGIELPNLQHIVPADVVSKYQLVGMIDPRREVEATEASEVIDRTLSTNNTELNERIWKAAGYKQIPTIEYLIQEMANL